MKTTSLTASRIGRFARRAALALCLIPAGAVRADPPPKTPPNTLSGIVVSKKDGQPLANVNVAMAHHREGSITLMNEGRISAWGPEETVFLLFTKRNSKSACQTTTDAEGRFTMTSFRKPSEGYAVVAAHREHGVAVLHHVIPADHKDAPLKIEIDEPAFVRLGTFDIKDDAATYMTSLAFADQRGMLEVMGDAESEAGEELMPNVVLSFWSSARDESSDSKLGPLPGGFEYIVTHEHWTQRVGAAATLLKRRIRLEPGQTLDLSTTAPDGAELTGRLALADGKALRDVNVMIKFGDKRQDIIGTVTDAEGRYRLRGVPEGSVLLELSRHAVRTAPG